MIEASCRFSFDDLYYARFGRAMKTQEKTELYTQPQEKRNNIVRRWAREAGWLTENRVGSDGVMYTAFWKGGE